MANSTTLNSVDYGPAVSGYTSWTCTSEDRQLADILLSVHTNCNTDLIQVDIDTPNGCIPVILEQVEEGSPCVVTLRCDPQRPTLISSLLVISEARTVEVYSLSGDYCGTCRGEKMPSTQQHSTDRGPFYRKHLALDCPSTACEVKLLSLDERTSVAVVRVVLGLRPLKLGMVQSIDMERVQSMVQEMGTSLSPGAQSLMDMVQFQQKNQTGMLGGFLPLFLGGGTHTALARGTTGPPGAAPTMTQPPGNTGLTDPCQLSENGAQSGGESDSGVSSCASQDEALQPDESPGQPSEGPGLHPLVQKTSTGTASSYSHSSHARLADMSPFLTGLTGLGRGGCLSPDLLPMLQSVCGQVTQLRIDDAAAKEEERKASGLHEGQSCCRALEELLVNRLEQMETRLKEHLDRRLDVLEIRLQTALLQAVPQGTLNQQTKASQAAPDHTHPDQTQTQPLSGH